MWLQEMMLGCDTELFETVRKAWRRQKGGLGFSALSVLRVLVVKDKVWSYQLPLMNCMMNACLSR